MGEGVVKYISIGFMQKEIHEKTKGIKGVPCGNIRTVHLEGPSKENAL